MLLAMIASVVLVLLVVLIHYEALRHASLGYGDIYPLGGLRLVAGIETVAGLMMIGWSASFTCLTMEKFRDLHGPRRG